MDFAGANPVTIPVTDLFSALDRGVIEGVHSYHQDIEGVLNSETWVLY